jgi:hypothetical protein
MANALAKSSNRELRNARQRRYRTRLKDQLKVLKLTADPVDVADLLRDAGIAIPNSDPETLNKYLTDFIRLWNEGRIGITLDPDPEE